jgi:deoxyribonuclease V
MRVRTLHSWDLDTAEAAALQTRLRPLLREGGTPRTLRTVAGADVSYDRRSPTLHAAVVVLDARTFEVVEIARAGGRARFPYLPGFLSFREVPPLLDAFSKLSRRPDLLVCDGQGLAHPRRFGLACHLGLIVDIPTFGCAKTRLVGEHREPGPRRGQRARLVDRGETIGTVLRTRERVKPVYVSVGHRINLDAARRLTLRLCRGFRLPEPVRRAHAESNRMRRERSMPRSQRVSEAVTAMPGRAP